MRLPSKDSAVARSLRVVAYVAGAVVISYGLKGQDVSQIYKYFPDVAKLVVALPPVISLIVGLYRKDVKNY